jgi:hypothetical protein
MTSAIQVVEGRQEAAPDAELKRLRGRVARTAHPCGCKSGALLSLVALAGWPIWLIAWHRPGSLLGALLAVPLYLAVVVAAGATGKVAGMAAGRVRHRRLRQRLTALTSPTGPRRAPAPTRG